MIMSQEWDSSGLRVAVTGADGFLGREVVAALRARNAVPVLLSEDVRNPLLLDTQVDVVCHLAGMVGEFFARDPAEGTRVNVIGTLNALELCRRSRARLVLASSCAVYRPFRGAVKETDPVGPIESYGLSKHMAELLCCAHAQFAGVSTVILRIFNPYGPGQSQGFLIPYLCRMVRAGEILRLKHPDSIRDFIYVQDLAEAVRRACLLDGQPTILNIGSGVPSCVIEAVEIISRLTGSQAKWEQAPGTHEDRYGGMWADISAARSKLNWSPSICLEKGLQLALNGY